MNAGVSQLFDLSERVAIVTGGTKGLGRSMAEGLAGAGASIVVVSRDQDACSRVADEISASTGQPALGVGCHLGEWDALPSLVETVRDRFGRIDILVNNAGINPAPTSVIDMSSAYLDKLFAVNVKGPVRLAGLVAPIMAERAKGSVINVATVGAYAGRGKFRRVHLGESGPHQLHQGDGQGMGVHGHPCQRPLARALQLHHDAGRGEAGCRVQYPRRAATLQHRVADCDEIIGAAIDLASDASSFVTGEDHVVAGGMPRDDAAHVSPRRQGRADHGREQGPRPGHGVGVRRAPGPTWSWPAARPRRVRAWPQKFGPWVAGPWP